MKGGLVKKRRTLKKVLIIDDDAYLVQSIKRWLRHHGFDCYTMCHPELAFDTIEALKPDLILLDLNMPRISGFGLLREFKVRETIRNIPVIVLTGHNHHEIASQVLDLGAKAYLVKTFILRDLAPLIRSYINVSASLA